jgi:general secretion pathway protein D
MRNSGRIILAAFVLLMSLSWSADALAQEEDSKSTDTLNPGILLNFNEASLDTVLEYLSEVAGLVVVKDVDVAGRMTVMSRQPLNLEEAVSLINTVLKERGYAAIRMGRTLRIVSLTDAKVMNIPVRSGNDPEMIALGDDVITQVIPVRFANAVKLKDDLASLIPSYANLAANADSNTLILTDTTANIRRLVEIVRALDTHMAAVAEVKVFHLRYSDATNTAKLINDIFKEEEQTTQQQQRGGFFGRMRSFMGPGGPGGQQTAQTEEAHPSTKVIASADERTNSVVVSGPPDTLKVVEKVVGDLDSNPEEEQSVFIYPLKNARADNLKGVLNNLFTEMEARTTGGASTQRGQTQTRRAGSTAAAQGAGQAAAQAAADLSGQVYFEADDDTNSLLVMTASKNFQRIKQILADLDKPVPQVLIKVLLAEVTHDKSTDLGAEFSLLNMRESGRGSSLVTDFAVADQTGGLVVKTIEKNIEATLRALEEVGKLDVLSRPYILTGNNQAATITVGEEVPFIRNTRVTETGQTINTIEYEDIGIILSVTPHINPEGLVIMDVKPEISAITGKTVPISETVNAAVFAKRSAASRVAVRDGQTIVIGGLIEDQKTENIKKVPLLGDIPLVGRLFQRSVKEKTKTELLIFLTPYVATKDEELLAISEKEKTSTHLLQNAVAPGTFEEHMKNMQSEKPLHENEKTE